MILITRPEQKLAKSVAAFRLAGISCSGVAPLTITACEEELSRLAHHLATQPADYIIVTSALPRSYYLHYRCQHCPPAGLR